MRPVKLTMSAFGPYSQVEVIDFEELQERNLFLVTGPTGSGKTTIFDAISYALYGKASGDLRTEETLRSDFSEAELLTEVSLTFELKGLVYHIHRIPKQMRPKNRSEGFTEQKPEATLTVVDGGPKTTVAGVSKVNKKVEELLGINEEQFKQIMMIPQGEFRKLLTSDSQEREKVLQQLFDTYIYRRIQSDLNEQAKSLNGEIKSKKVERDTLVTKIKCGEDEALKAMIEAEDKFIDVIITKTKALTKVDAKLVKGLNDALKKVDNGIEATLKAQAKAEEDNKNIDQKILVESALKDQEKLADSMAAQERTIALAEKAARLVGTEDNILSREEVLKSKENNLKKTKVKVEDLASKLEQVSRDLKAETTREKEEARNHLKLELAEYKGYIEKVESIETLSKNLEKTKSKLEEVDQTIKEKMQRHDKLDNEIESYEKELQALKDVAVDLERAKHLYEKEALRYGLLEKVASQINALVAMNKVKDVKTEDLEGSYKSYEIDQRAYKEARFLFVSQQAAMLAKELEVNNPCPVCGSLDHPSPAKLPEAAILEAELEALESQMKVSEEKHRKAKEALAVLMERCNNQATINQNLIEDVLEEDAATLVGQNLALQIEGVKSWLQASGQKLKTIKEEITSLGIKNKRYLYLDEAIKTNKQQKDELSEETKVVEQEKTRLMTLIAEQSTGLNHIYKEVPEQMRTIDALQQGIREVEEAIRRGEEKLKHLTEAFEMASNIHIQTSTEYTEMTKNMAEDQDTLEALRGSFTAQLLKAGFENRDQYGSSKIEEASLEVMKENQVDYHRNLDRLKTSLKDLVEKTKGTEKVDLEPFELGIKKQQEERQIITDEQGVIKARVLDNEATIKQVEWINDQIKDKEGQYNVVGKLARIALGNNPKMMTFERYVLAAFLEDILKAANIRLRQMTQGRYILSRTSALQRKNKQSGLELEVFDNFTGKSRHVKTLSGGEGFKASLSMALGLSDVVQSYAGGVRLDTMFIDEGFGTLDQESLDSAINCLIDLQKSGRLVGIISHVQELKERIDTRLEIISTNKGSESRFVLG